MTRLHLLTAPLALSCLLLVVALPVPLLAQAQFEEQQGYLVMEMESVPIPAGADWTEQSALAGYTGSGYYRFTGNGICNGPANSPLRYTFRIVTPGTYELRLRATRIYHCVQGTPEGNANHCKEGGGAQRGCESFGEPSGDQCADASHCIRTDLSNDAFISIEDANGDHVGWVGQNDTKATKLFGGGNNAWRWTGTRALDPGGAKRDARWDLAAGEYALIVQGRSKDFRIDRIVLFDIDSNSINGAEDLPETLASPEPPEEDMGQQHADAGMEGAEEMGQAADMAPELDLVELRDAGVVSDLVEMDLISGADDMSLDPGVVDMARHGALDQGEEGAAPNEPSPSEGCAGCASSARGARPSPALALGIFCFGLALAGRRRARRR